jgi:outer membrane lipoprotein SlyB
MPTGRIARPSAAGYYFADYVKYQHRKQPVSMSSTSGKIGVLVLLCGGMGLTGCEFSTQNRYNYQDVGQATLVQFGTVLASRPVQITGENTGAGALLGAGGGAAAGAQFGRSGGNVAAALGGAAIGAVAGYAAEQILSNRNGIEYTITLSNGKTITIAQNQKAEDVVFNQGDRVMVQVNGTYQRVLPASNLPETVQRPKDIKVVD